MLPTIGEVEIDYVAINLFNETRMETMSIICTILLITASKKSFDATPQSPLREKSVLTRDTYSTSDLDVIPEVSSCKPNQ